MFTKAGRISGMALSEIVQLSEAANRRRDEGHDVLSFATGEPDFPTPPHICEAAYAAMQAGETRYPPTAGTAALRDAVADQADGDQARENVIICTGAKQVIANAFAASLNAGDEVIIPAPYWSTYIDTVQLFEGVPVVVNCTAAQGFKITPEQLEAAITPKTKWLMLTRPQTLPARSIRQRNWRHSKRFYCATPMCGSCPMRFTSTFATSRLPLAPLRCPDFRTGCWS